jgi:8-oxo-dGTP diphosphatase
VTAPLFQVVVCAAIVNSEKKVFIARRAPGKKLEGFWEFPGGKLESSEDLEGALHRELSEELGISVRIKTLLHVKPHSYAHGNTLILFYLCDSPVGELQLKDHDQMLWCTVDELKSLKLLPANAEALEKLKAALS